MHKQNKEKTQLQCKYYFGKLEELFSRTNKLKKLAEVTSCVFLTEKVHLYMSLPYDPPSIQQFVDDLDALS